MEIRTRLTPNKLIVLDKRGVELTLNKYVSMDKNGKHEERLEMHMSEDEPFLDVPVSEFDAVIDVIKARFSAKVATK